MAAATEDAEAIRAGVATEEGDIPQTTEAMENGATATDSAEATATMPKGKKEEVPLMVTAVRHTETGRPMDSTGATAAATMKEVKEGHPTDILHSMRAVLPTDSAEATATMPKGKREDRPTGKAVLPTETDLHMDSAEATAQVRKKEKEGHHIQGGQLQDMDSVPSKVVFQQARDHPIRGLKDSDAKTNRTSRKRMRPESTRCFPENRRLTPQCRTTTMFLPL